MLKKLISAFFVFCTLAVLSQLLMVSSVQAEEVSSIEIASQGQQVADVQSSQTDETITSEGEISGNTENGSQNETQDTDYSCGPAALVTWIRILGGEATEAELIVLAKTNAEEGTSFLNLKNAAIAKGYLKALVYKFIRSDILKITSPALVYLNVEGSEIGHFAVLTKIENNIFFIYDPQAGEITKTEEEFFSEFGEYAMVNGEISFEQATSTQEPTVDNASVASVGLESNEIASVESQSTPSIMSTTLANTPTPVAIVPKTTVASDETLACVLGKGWPVLFAAAAGYLTVHSHAIQQFASRGISLAMIRAALSNPQRLTMVWSRYGPQLHYYSNRVVIVVDMWARKIITGWKY